MDLGTLTKFSLRIIANATTFMSIQEYEKMIWLIFLKTSKWNFQWASVFDSVSCWWKSRRSKAFFRRCETKIEMCQTYTFLRFEDGIIHMSQALKKY